MELPFAALQQVCAPMMDRIEGLPDPQRDALCVAFGVSAGPAPDRFLVGLAVLGLLSMVGEEQPLLCVVDDSQWLDHASTHALAFVARRLQAESVGFLFASRKPPEAFSGLTELMLEGLGARDARELLRSVIPGPLDDAVFERLVAETRGNPLALLELPRGLTPAQFGGCRAGSSAASCDGWRGFLRSKSSTPSPKRLGARPRPRAPSRSRPPKVGRPRHFDWSMPTCLNC